MGTVHCHDSKVTCERSIRFLLYVRAQVIMIQCGIIQHQWLVLIVVINDLFYNKSTLFDELDLVVRSVDPITHCVKIVLIVGIQNQTDSFTMCQYARLNTCCLSLNSTTNSCNAVTMVLRLSTSSLKIKTSSSRGDKMLAED